MNQLAKLQAGWVRWRATQQPAPPPVPKRVPVTIFKQARDELGLTNREIARLTGIDQRHITRVFNEQETVNRKTAERLARCFGLDPVQVGV